jgi:hypothetical protein
MEDILGEPPIVDIDARDVNNHLAVVDCIEGLYSYYRKIEVHSFPSFNIFDLLA